MIPSIDSRIHRTLRKTRGFCTLQSDSTLEASLQSLCLNLRSGERLIGVYENHPNSLKDAILVTNHGLFILQEDHWVPIAYSEMKTAKFASRKTPDISDLVVTLENGRHILIKIDGGDYSRGIRDISEFLRFLLRVIQDFEEKKGAG